MMNSKLATALFIASISMLAHGETFVGPTTSTNRLLVPSNSAIVITATLGDFTNSTQVELSGFQFSQSYFAPLENGSAYALAGPAELVFSNPGLFTYYRVTNWDIRTQVILNDPITLSIGSNQTMRLFGVSAPVAASFVRPGTGFVGFTLEPNQPAEFTGPGELAIDRGGTDIDKTIVRSFTQCAFSSARFSTERKSSASEFSSLRQAVTC